VCRRKIHREPHHLSANGDFSWEEVECLGACVNAPMIQIWKDTYEDLTPASLETILDAFAAGRKPRPGPQVDRQFSAPVGGPTTITDPSFYGGSPIPHPRAARPGAEPAAPLPPPEAAKPRTAAAETAPAVASASAEKTAEADQSRERIKARAEAAATPEKT